MLSQVDPTVKRETCYIAGFVLIFSVIMELAFLLAGAWDITVLLGNLLGGLVAVGNFFLMGLTIQRALGKSEKDAAARMKLSQSLRLIMQLLFCAVGAAAPCFNLIASVVPLLFPRVAVMLRPLLNKKDKVEDA